MKSRRALGFLLVLAISVAPFPAVAEESSVMQEAETLWSVGTSLAGSIANYVGSKVVGPVIDKAQASDKEKALQQVEAHLQIKLDQNAGNRRAVEKQISVAKSELKILHQLVVNKPDPKQMTLYREELASDLATIRSTLAEHERRLDEHDREIADQGKLIEKQRSELDDLRQRLDRPGASLKIEVRGEANLIRLREATHPVLVGNFKLSRNGVTAAYFLPPESRAVIEIFAPGNRISIPARLAQRVKIIDHGFQYDKLVF